MLAEEVSLDETQAIAKIVRCLSLDNSRDSQPKPKPRMKRGLNCSQIFVCLADYGLPLRT